VVATDVRGCREVVEPGVTGELVPVRDTEALAAALGALGDVTRRGELGRRARSRAVAHFDEDRVVEIVLDTYRDVGERKGIGLGGL
jgi:glycosyltransferase involved in cell wall biosynthesis